MNIKNKILNKSRIVLGLFFYLFFVLQTKAMVNLKNDMLPNNKTVGIDGTDVGIVSEITVYLKDFLFNILALIAIGVFLYFGFKLITSRGNSEEFKKTLVGFVYAIVGLAIIPLAYVVITLVSSLDF